MCLRDPALFQTRKCTHRCYSDIIVRNGTSEGNHYVRAKRIAKKMSSSAKPRSSLIMDFTHHSNGLVIKERAVDGKHSDSNQTHSRDEAFRAASGRRQEEKLTAIDRVVEKSRCYQESPLSNKESKQN